MWNITKKTAEAINYVLAGWICVIFTLGLVICVIAKIPVDTQFFTIANSVIIVFVGSAVRKSGDENSNKQYSSAPDTTPYLQTK